MPLNPDATTQLAIAVALLFTPLTPGWAGILSPAGQATAAFNIPPGVLPPGLTFNLCTLCGTPGWASNTVTVHVVP